MIVSLKPAYLDRAQTAAYVSLGPTTMDDMIKAGKFPKPRQLSPQRVGWRMSELEAWCDDRPVSNLPPPRNTGRRTATAQPGAPSAQTAA